MHRFTAFAAFAALIAGCSDAPVAPTSLLGTGPLYDEGVPPPPPVSGRGEGSFSASDDFDASLAALVVAGCFVSTATQYDFVYTTDQSMDPIGIHQVAHIKFDGTLLPGEELSHQIVIRQAPHDIARVDANGMIVGPGFSFRITSTNNGNLTPAEFFVSVNGILKTAEGSCEASGQFSGPLTPVIVPEG
jgi:hypothetical protein